MENSPKYINARQLALLYGVSESYIYKEILKNHIECIRINKTVRIPLSYVKKVDTIGENIVGLPKREYLKIAYAMLHSSNERIQQWLEVIIRQ